ncbi:YceD family protein [Desulfosarcina alkanivorans]|nr:DUF177 domain-containing protein [Desulfosarcina alkanivorans]
MDETVEAALLPLLHAVSSEGDIRFTRPVRLRLHAMLAGETIRIDGTVTTAVRMPCSRCLERFDLPLSADFSATAAPQQPSMNDTGAGEDIELSADEMDVIGYSGDSVDLADEVAQQVIMALPFKPVCRDTCEGLCSQCGANLNQAPCRCPSRDEANPFAVLKTLSFSDDKR